MIIVHKDVDGDTDDDIDDDNDCITTSKPTHTLIDDDIDHQVHNQPTQLPNSYHPLVSYDVQTAGEEGDVGDDNFNDDEDVDEDGDNDDDARWFRWDTNLFGFHVKDQLDQLLGQWRCLIW